MLLFSVVIPVMPRLIQRTGESSGATTQDLTILSICYSASMMASTPFFGWLSDHHHKWNKFFLLGSLLALVYLVQCLLLRIFGRERLLIYVDMCTL
jgi:hypothetical protein